jgi:hypothetical protein
MLFNDCRPVWNSDFDTHYLHGIQDGNFSVIKDVTNEQKIDAIMDEVEKFGAHEMMALYEKVIDAYRRRTNELDPHDNS